VGDYLKGNPLLRSDASHTCSSELVQSTGSLNHQVYDSQACDDELKSSTCEKQPSQRALMTLFTWFEALTKDGDESKVHNPLSQTPRIQVLKLIGEGPLNQGNDESLNPT
jgi:hypothetical protein